MSPWQRRVGRFAGATLLALLAAAAVPAAASAANVTVSGNTLTFFAAAGEVNDVVVQKLAAVYRVSDTANAITTAGPCSNASPRQVNCPLGTINLVRVSLYDQDDVARIVGVVTTEVFGGPGTDILTGGNGQDLLHSGPGQHDRLIGNQGNDTLNAAGSGGLLYLNGGFGNDTLSAGNVPGAATFVGFFSQLEGGPGTDTLIGTSSNEMFIGGPGPDTIQGGSGGNSGYGGDAIDIARYDDHAEAVIVTTGDNLPNDGGSSDGPAAARDKLLGIEGVIGGAGNDTITGSAVQDMLLGLGGSDTLNGAGGADNLCGDGALFITPETFYFAASCSNTPGQAGDVLNGGDGNDALMGNWGPDMLNGGPGSDNVSYSDKSARVVVTLADVVANDGEVDIDPATAGNQPEGDKATGVESASGGAASDTLTGTAGANVLYGGPGDDTLNGLAGDDSLCGDSVFYWILVVQPLPLYCSQAGSALTTSVDTLNGGDGNDILAGQLHGDTINGGLGIDTTTYTEKSSRVAATIDGAANDGEVDTDPSLAGNQPENDRIATDNENVVGSFYNDTLSGSAGANQLSGGGGTDTLNGLGGADVLDPGGGTGDVVNGGPGFDYASYGGFFIGAGITVTLDGVANDGPTFSPENDNVKADVEGLLGTPFGDTLTGPATVTANTLVGYGGADTLDGKAGDDALTGGPGSDSLFGDAGNDLLSLLDGEADNGDCGAGADRAMRDSALDSVTNCETLQAPAALEPLADPSSPAFRRLERAVACQAALAAPMT